MNNYYGTNSGLAGSMLNWGFDSAMSSQMGSGMQGGTFSNLLGQITGGIQRNASMGIMPGQGTGNMTPQQIAAQMGMGGGISSLLPLLGNSFLPKLMFPVAGLMTVFQVAQSAMQMKNDLDQSRPQLGLDPRDLNYSKAVEAVQVASAEGQHLGPFA